jgi:transposase
MGKNRTTAAKTQKIKTRRKTMDRQSKSIRRNPLDTPYRRTMGRFAKAIPKSINMLAEAKRLGTTRCVAQRMASFSFRTRPAGTIGLERGIRGRQFRPCKKRGQCVGKTKRGKGTKWMVVVDGQGIPLGNHLDSASPSEVTLLEKTLNNIAVPREGRGRPRKNPKRLITDKGYDSDPLRERLAGKGIELICPYRSNNKGQKYHDGRKMRRYKRRYKVERTFSWLGNFRRLVVRWDHDIAIYNAFFHIACLIITLRRL